jgi:hypothetical protein
MKLFDDCLYTLYVITYALGKKLQHKKNNGLSDITASITNF